MIFFPDGFGFIEEKSKHVPLSRSSLQSK